MYCTFHPCRYLTIPLRSDYVVYCVFLHHVLNRYLFPLWRAYYYRKTTSRLSFFFLSCCSFNKSHRCNYDKPPIWPKFGRSMGKRFPLGLALPPRLKFRCPGSWISSSKHLRNPSGSSLAYQRSSLVRLHDSGYDTPELGFRSSDGGIHPALIASLSSGASVLMIAPPRQNQNARMVKESNGSTITLIGKKKRARQRDREP